MLQTLRKIFGVGPGDLQAGVTETEPPRYMPESKLHQEIHGDDAGDWRPWRIDADGEQWYERVPADEQPGIVAELADEIPEDDASAEEFFDSDFLAEETTEQLYYRQQSLNAIGGGVRKTDPELESLRQQLRDAFNNGGNGDE